jgi:hypothetical protein
MNVRTLIVILSVVAIPGPAAAGRLEQQPPANPAPMPRTPSPSTPPAPPAGERPAAPRERRESQPINIKVEVTITDQRGGAPALKKTVTVVTGDGLGGFIRSTALYKNLGSVPLNVDTQPAILSDGKIRLSVNLQYDLPSTSAADEADRGIAGALAKTQIHENLSLILESGKPIVAAQSADPVGDRQVTIEVKATILR